MFSSYLILSPSGAALAQSDSTSIDTSTSSQFSDIKWGAGLNVGFPFVFNGSVDGLWDQTYGAGVNLGYFQFTEDRFKVSSINYDVRFRWFPTEYGLFAGLGLGQQIVTITADMGFAIEGATENFQATGKSKISALYLLPHLGWHHFLTDHIYLGFELGLRSILSSTIDTTFDFSYLPNNSTADEAAATDSYQSAKHIVDSASESLSRKNLLYVSLLKAGWMF